jgi:hypothetical protein
LITGITIVFFAVVSFSILVTLRPGSSKVVVSQRSPVPVEAK